MRQQLLTLARYNAWATTKLLNEHIASLDEDDYRRNVGLFFKSIHGTLNHLLVGEHLLWYRRFAEGVSPIVQLNAEIESDRDQLTARLLAGAALWQPLIERIDDTQFAGKLNYTTMRGTAASLPYVPTLMHVFNHATHHRGQITAALTMLHKPCPEIDLVYFLQTEQTT